MILSDYSQMCGLYLLVLTEIMKILGKKSALKNMKKEDES